MKTIFNQDMIAQCVLTDSQAEQFRKEAERRMTVDDETLGQVTYYKHADGRILVDSVKFP